MSKQEELERIKFELTQPTPSLSKDLIPLLSDPACVAEVTKALDDRWQRAKTAAAGQRLAGAGGDTQGTELLEQARRMMRDDLKLDEF